MEKYYVVFQIDDEDFKPYVVFNDTTIINYKQRKESSEKYPLEEAISHIKRCFTIRDFDRGQIGYVEGEETGVRIPIQFFL